MKQLESLIWPCLEKEKEKERRRECKEKSVRKKKKKKSKFKEYIRSLDGLKTERQSMKKLEEPC